MNETEIAIKFFREHLKIDNLKYGERQAIHMAIKALENQPVRCGECRGWKRKCANVGECEKLSDRDQEGGAQFDCDMDDDDFCSYGQRKEAT